MRRTFVRLNLPELAVLLNALEQAMPRRPDRDERSAARRLTQARDRLARKVRERAAGGGWKS